MQLEQLVLQAGGVGVAIYALWTMRQLLSNHLSHNTKSIEKNTEVLGRLENAINKLSELIDRKL